MGCASNLPEVTSCCMSSLRPAVIFFVCIIVLERGFPVTASLTCPLIPICACSEVETNILFAYNNISPSLKSQFLHSSLQYKAD